MVLVPNKRNFDEKNQRCRLCSIKEYKILVLIYGLFIHRLLSLTPLNKSIKLNKIQAKWYKNKISVQFQTFFGTREKKNRSFYPGIAVHDQPSLLYTCYIGICINHKNGFTNRELWIVWGMDSCANSWRRSLRRVSTFSFRQPLCYTHIIYKACKESTL